MKKLLLPLLGLILIWMPANGQELMQVEVADPLVNQLSGEVIVPTADGGMLLAGANSIDPVIFKLDASGQVEWSKSINVDISYSSYSFHDGGMLNSGNGYYLLGETQTSMQDSSIIYLIQIDANGNITHSQSFTLPLIGIYKRHMAQQHPNGDFTLMLSQYESVGIIRTDVNGAAAWSKTFEIDTLWRKNPPFGVAVTDDGGTICTAKANNDEWILRTDANGNVVYSKRYRPAWYTQARAFIRGADGFYYSSGYMTTDNGDVTFLRKMDEWGNVMWTTTLDPMSFFFLADKMHQFANGTIVVTGLSGTSGHHMFLEFNTNGDLLKVTEGTLISGTSYSPMNSAITPDRTGLAMVGTRFYNGGNSTAEVTKIGQYNRNVCNLTDVQTTYTNSGLLLNNMPNIVVERTVPLIPGGLSIAATDITLSSSDICIALGESEQAAADQVEMTLYPNPANGQAEIALSMPLEQTGNLSINVFGVDGQLVATYPLSSSAFTAGNSAFVLNTGQLATGMYLVELTNGENLKLVQRLQVMH